MRRAGCGVIPTAHARGRRTFRASTPGAAASPYREQSISQQFDRKFAVFRTRSETLFDGHAVVLASCGGPAVILRKPRCASQVPGLSFYGDLGGQHGPHGAYHPHHCYFDIRRCRLVLAGSLALVSDPSQERLGNGTDDVPALKCDWSAGMAVDQIEHGLSDVASIRRSNAFCGLGRVPV